MHSMDVFTVTSHMYLTSQKSLWSCDLVIWIYAEPILEFSSYKLKMGVY